MLGFGGKHFALDKGGWRNTLLPAMFASADKGGTDPTLLAMMAVELEDMPLDVHQERVAVVRLRWHKKRALDVACV